MIEEYCKYESKKKENKTAIEVIKEGAFGGTYFSGTKRYLSGTKVRGKNLFI